MNRRDFLQHALTGAALAATGCATTSRSSSANSNPNIVYILADDMGYGDVACLNPQARSRRPTSIASRATA